MVDIVLVLVCDLASVTWLRELGEIGVRVVVRHFFISYNLDILAILTISDFQKNFTFFNV
jgi:hypothetical protein